MLSNLSEYRFFAPCPRGLERLLAEELSSLGASALQTTAGGVAFAGSWETCYRANLWSRLASRVLWQIAEFRYATENDIYRETRALAWPQLFAVSRTLRVNVTAQRCTLRSVEFVTLRIKDAVCDRFRDDLGRRPSVDRVSPEVRVYAFLNAQRATLYLDTSGEPLFKRGWRKARGEAPLRENLAAGILLLSGWQPREPLLDPMCGGGTLLIEAAAMARCRAPGAQRGFGFEKFAAYDADLWKRVASERRSRTDVPLRLYGSDVDARALSAARRNLAAAGLERWVALEATDVLRRKAPPGEGVLIANPPYGARMGSEDELARFYPQLGNALKRNFIGWRCYLFTADLRLPKLIHLQATRRTVLYNGALECRLYEFRMVAGAHRGMQRAAQ